MHKFATGQIRKVFDVRISRFAKSALTRGDFVFSAPEQKLDDDDATEFMRIRAVPFVGKLSA